MTGRKSAKKLAQLAALHASNTKENALTETPGLLHETNTINAAHSLRRTRNQLNLLSLREARAGDASGMMKKFQEDYLREQKRRADDARANQIRIAQKKASESARLNAIGVEVDRDIILKMKLKQLTDQFKIHKFVLKDPLLSKVTQSSMKKKVDWQATVLAAVSRMYVMYLFSTFLFDSVLGLWTLPTIVLSDGMTDRLEVSMEMVLDDDLYLDDEDMTDEEDRMDFDWLYFFYY